MTAARRDRVALLLAAFGAVFLANIGVLGLKAEDWQLLPAFARMLGRGLPGVAELVFSDSLRIQTGTFLVQGLLTRAFGYAPLPLFLFSFGCHLASCALVYEILTELVADADLSAAAALACLFAPTCAGALFYVTHAFFVFPVALVLGLCLLYLRPLRDPRLDLACLTLLAELAQLSGEQTVPLVYCLFGLAALRARRSRSARDRLRAAVPVAFCAATLGWLLLRVIGPNLARQAAPAELRRPLSDVALQYVSFQLDSLSPWSWMFGRFSQPVSARTWAALAAVAGCLLLFHLRAPERGQRATARGRAALRRMFPALIGASLACLAPLLFSAASGYRFGIEPKYLYAPGFCMAIALIVVCDRAARRRRAFFATVILYFAFLTSYSLCDVWGVQKRIDDRIWALVDKHCTPRTKVLMLDGMAWRGLVPEWKSAAYSDFSGPATGAENRLRTTGVCSPVFVQRFGGDGGRRPLELVDVRDRHVRAEPAEILAIVFRHGARFSDEDRGFLAAFPAFEEYLRFRAAEPIRFTSSGTL